MYLIASMVIRGNDDVKDKKETALEYQHDACKLTLVRLLPDHFTVYYIF